MVNAMVDEVKKVSNTYEVSTLKEVKISKKVVEKLQTLNANQNRVLFWELVADKTRTIRDKAMLNLIREIEENVK